MILLLTTAFAQPPHASALSLGTRAGVGLSKSERSVQTGLGLVGLSGAYRTAPGFAVELSVSAGQSFDQPMFRRTEWMTSVKSVPLDPTPPITRVGWVADAVVVFTPLRGVLVAPQPAEFGLDFGVGGGVVHTIDGSETSWSSGDPVGRATERQSHPSWVLTGGPRVSLDSGWELSLRLRGRQWIEVFDGIDLRLTTMTDVGLGLSRRL